MMFDKDNTNYKGESLCDTCRYCDKYSNSNTYNWCIHDGEYRKDVGVCKDYENDKV